MNKLQQCMVIHEYLEFSDYENIDVDYVDIHVPVTVDHIYELYHSSLMYYTNMKSRRISRKEYEEEFC